MEEELSIVTVFFYMSLYPNTCLIFEWSVDGETILFGPIFIKTNSVNGRQTKNLINIPFRHDMHTIGVNIRQGLLTSTAEPQEMNKLDKTFKAMCNSTSQYIFTKRRYK